MYLCVCVCVCVCVYVCVCVCTCVCVSAGTDTEFIRGGANIKGGRCQPISRSHFPENCMKMTKIGSGGGEHASTILQL